MNRFTHFILLAVLCVSVGGAALGDAKRVDPASQGFDAERLKRLDAAIQAYIDRKVISGATALVARKGEIVHFGTYGAQSFETGVATDEETIYRIYSMTKPITGVAMMMLYEEGKFKLTDPLSMYMPEFAGLKVFAGVNDDGSPKTEDMNRPIIIADLMRHTAGLTYGLFSNTPVDKLVREKFTPDMTNESMVQGLSELPLLFQPGTRWHYSLSVDVQGALVERLSGMTLEDFFKTRIFDPLGMDDTGFWVPTRDQDRLAELYVIGPDGKTVMAPKTGNLVLKVMEEDKPSWLSGGGGLVSTTGDYFRFAQMLLNGGELDGVRLLSRTSVDLMREDHTFRYGINMGGLEKVGMGFGLNFGVILDPALTGTYASKGEYNWGGAAKTVFWIDPKEDIVVVFMTQLLTQAVDFRSDLRRFVYQALSD